MPICGKVEEEGAWEEDFEAEEWNEVAELDGGGRRGRRRRRGRKGRGPGVWWVDFTESDCFCDELCRG